MIDVSHNIVTGGSVKLEEKKYDKDYGKERWKGAGGWSIKG